MCNLWHSDGNKRSSNLFVCLNAAGGSDSDETNRKRKHSQISPIRWTPLDEPPAAAAAPPPPEGMWVPL
jgi:hypothetical protein